MSRGGVRPSVDARGTTTLGPPGPPGRSVGAVAGPGREDEPVHVDGSLCQHVGPRARGRRATRERTDDHARSQRGTERHQERRRGAGCQPWRTPEPRAATTRVGRLHAPRARESSDPTRAHPGGRPALRPAQSSTSSRSGRSASTCSCARCAALCGKMTHAEAADPICRACGAPVPRTGSPPSRPTGPGPSPSPWVPSRRTTRAATSPTITTARTSRG